MTSVRPFGFLRSAGTSILSLPEGTARDRLGFRITCKGVPCPRDARRGCRRPPEVEHVVGTQDGFLVVLDDNERVPEILRFLSVINEPGVVALVQSD